MPIASLDQIRPGRFDDKNRFEGRPCELRSDRACTNMHKLADAAKKYCALLTVYISSASLIVRPRFSNNSWHYRRRWNAITSPPHSYLQLRLTNIHRWHHFDESTTWWFRHAGAHAFVLHALCKTRYADDAHVDRELCGAASERADGRTFAHLIGVK